MKMRSYSIKLSVLAGGALSLLASCTKEDSAAQDGASPPALIAMGADYPKVDPSDELAAHPADPDRMAAGVALEKIVPKLALNACEKAVAEHPKVARFHYQLGRALAASGRPEEALESYEKAAAMGYRMANYNLGLCYGDGDGVARSEEKAKEYFERAVKAGVEIAKASLAMYVFSSEGFSNPAFFQAMHDSDYAALQADPTALATYIITFTTPFEGASDCGQVISSEALSVLRTHVASKVLGMYLGGAANARHDHAPGDFAGAGAAGMKAGMQLSRDLAAMTDQGKNDAQLFYDRHSCSSPVAKRFFGNLDRFARNLGNPNFLEELKKNVR